MDFKKQLQDISESVKSPRLENIKRLLKNAASNGEKTTTIDEKFYDKLCITWLKNEGFRVKETNDQRQGSFIRISW